MKILGIYSYPILLDSRNRLNIVSIQDNTGLIENVFHEMLLLLKKCIDNLLGCKTNENEMSIVLDLQSQSN